MHHHLSRRSFLRQAVSLAALGLPALPAAASPAAKGLTATERVSTELRELAYFTAGPPDGRPVVLAHDLGHDIDSFAGIAPLLAASGLRVLAPQLHGHGAARPAQQAAPGKDLIDFIDALHIPEAVFAGVGSGAHAAWAASRLRPTRCVGLVLANPKGIDSDSPDTGTASMLLENGAAPQAFADAVLALARAGKWRTPSLHPLRQETTS